MTTKRLLLLVPLLLVLTPASAHAAASSSPAWSVRSVALPTSFSTEATPRCTSVEKYCDAYVVTATNVGSAPSEGIVTVKDRLPAGIVAVEKDFGEEYEPGGSGTNGLSCYPTKPKLVDCKYEGGAVPPGGVIEYRVDVEAEEAAATAGAVTNLVEVEGGGAPTVVSGPPETVANTVNRALPVFGLQDLGAGVLGPEGAPFAQAGGHPSLVTTTLDYNTLLNGENEGSLDHFLAVADPKTEIVDLPLGLVGDPSVAAQCSEAAVVGTHNRPTKCPADTRVGLVDVQSQGGGSEIIDLFNMPPEAGYPAEFGFEFDETLVTLLPRLLPTEDGYALSVTAAGLPRSQEIKVTGARVTFFGDPTEQDGGGRGEAFLRDPTDCGTGPLAASLEVDSWVDPGDWVGPGSPQGSPTEATMFETSSSQGVSGCDALQFDPSIAVTPETTETDTPSGYEVDVKVPQSANVEGNLATPDLKDATVTLPAGVSISPSAANGLVACQTSGPEGIELGDHDAVNADQMAGEGRLQEGEEIGPDGLVHPAAGHCPAASRVGEVEVITPILPQPLKGGVFVAAPQCGNPGQKECSSRSAEDGELFGIYLEVGSVAYGIHVKLRGQVSVNPQTGQVSTRFSELPQQPVSEIRLKLNAGPRAPLANPQSCAGLPAGPNGQPLAVTSSDLTPWSTPYTPDATPPSSFPVGCGGGAFSPGFAAGMWSTLHAGSYSPFTLTLSRHDGEQDLSGLTVNMPQGLLGKIAGIAECGSAEVAAAEANTGGCPAVSRLGTATAAAGAGSTPFWQSGNVYLTGPYNGAPFGLAVVVPANAGPFHLGNIVVRAAIHINPSTAQVSVVSNPLPQMIDGVPLRLQTVTVTVGEGDDFTFNPTSCAPRTIAATIGSAQGSSANVSAPFAATGCASLPFKPVLSASAAGKASKAGGASLDVKVTSSAGQANVAKVDLQLPKQLSSRLTTLQKACTEAQFAANPAGCPVASDIGSAVVHTPLLNGPLAGPVYLVSHGGAAFPDVEIILQGEGVQLILDGKTQIKNGITYSHFETVPDAPFTSFETKLPTGKYSIFGANLPAKDDYNLCGQSLLMPIELVGQNGAVIKQATKLSVTGCPKAKKATKKKKKAKAKRATKTSRGAK
jgi:hypothetical protein